MFVFQLKNTVTVHVWKEGGWQSELDSITKSGHEAIFYSCWYLNYIKYAEDWIDFYRCDPGTFSSKWHFLMNGTNDNSNFVSLFREWNTIGAVQRWWCCHVEWICRRNEFNLKVMVGATWLLKQTHFYRPRGAVVGERLWSPASVTDVNNMRTRISVYTCWLRA